MARVSKSPSLSRWMFALALGCGLIGSEAFAQSYQVQSLGPTGTYANGLNGKGQVTGSLSTGSSSFQAFLSGDNGQGVQAVTSFPGDANATAINFSGQITGWVTTSSSPYQFQAFVTGPGAQNPIILTGLGGAFSSGQAINSAGSVVGYSRNAANKNRPVIWSDTSRPAVDLGTLGGQTGIAGDINAAGLIVGNASNLQGQSRAVVWGLNGAAITDLGTFGGASGAAYSLNDQAQVAGKAQTLDGSYHAFFTGLGASGLTDLGTLGWGHSQASEINEFGVVAGILFNSPDDQGYLAAHVFITGVNGQGMVDLNTLASPGEGLYFNEVWGLNDAGQVLVRDQLGTSYLLTPVPEGSTWAMMLAGLLVLGLSARQRRAAS